LQAAIDAKQKNPLKERMAELQAAVDAEEKRLNSKAYKNALKTVDELATQAEELRTEATKAIDAFYTIMEKWEETVNKHKAIWKEHKIDAPDLYSREAKKIGIVTIKRKVETLRKAEKQLKALSVKPGTVKTVNNKRGFLKLTEHEKMMRERYPEN